MARKSAERKPRMPTSAPWILGTLGAGAVGALALRPGSTGWLASLDVPPWMPDTWIFGPMTAIALIALGAGAALVWDERERSPVRAAIGLYAGVLCCTALWPHLFFGSRATDLAMLDLSLLWILALLTLLAFYRVRRLAGGLLIPLLSFATFAAALNLSVWLRNG